jgi:hypothetical protein
MPTTPQLPELEFRERRTSNQQVLRQPHGQSRLWRYSWVGSVRSPAFSPQNPRKIRDPFPALNPPISEV